MSVICTGVSFFVPGIIDTYAMGSWFLEAQNIPQFLLQVMLFQFLHGGILHVLFNCLMLVMVGRKFFTLLGERDFWIFFFSFSLLLALTLATFSDGATLGISGFVLALISLIWCEARRQGKTELASSLGATMIVSLLLGLDPDVSFIAHFFGIVYGIIFWLLLVAFDRKIQPIPSDSLL